MHRSLFRQNKVCRKCISIKMQLTFKKETVYVLCSQILHSKISETKLYLYKLVRGETR